MTTPSKTNMNTKQLEEIHKQFELISGRDSYIMPEPLLNDGEWTSYLDKMWQWFEKQLTQAKEAGRKENKCIHGKDCIECLGDKGKKGLLPV